MPMNDPRQPVENVWRTQEGETVEITNQTIHARARKLEREAVAFYWAAWVLIPVFIAIYIRNMLRIHEPLLIAGTGLGLATLLLIAGAIVRHRPARVSPSAPCLEFVRNMLEVKYRGAMWIRRALLLAIAAVICCRAARPGASLIPFAAAGLGIGFCWYAFWHEGRRYKRELDALGKGE
jgi:hypothetical protein